MEEKRILVLIPARFASTRFPGKPLAMIAGKSMIQRVFENCLLANEEASKASTSDSSNEGSRKNSPKSKPKMTFSVFVITDNLQIENHVKSFSGNVLRIDDDVSSGTERIYLSFKRHFKDQDFDLVINVQGDEPLLGPYDLIKLANFHLKKSHDITTLVKPMEGLCQDFTDENKVKVIFSEDSGECHYFSRAPIPFHRNEVSTNRWYLHIGIYSYTPDALFKFYNSPKCYGEKVEGLEQLRAINLGMKIGAVTTNKTLIGVDTPNDIKILEGVIGSGKTEQKV